MSVFSSGGSVNAAIAALLIFLGSFTDVFFRFRYAPTAASLLLSVAAVLEGDVFNPPS